MELAKLEGDEIIIRVKVSDLTSLAYEGFGQAGYFDYDGDGELDIKQLGLEVVGALNSESENGTTLVHKALDEAIIELSDNGSELFAYLDQ